MNLLMSLKRISASEAFLAFWALVLLVGSVYSLMALEVFAPAELFVAEGAL